jgi:DNA recombination protein RmuC
MAEQIDKKLDELKKAVETKLTQIQTDNSAKLEEMRKTVDEKLQGTLEKRLGESFRQVSERLEQVHKGLGEMQNLAIGVGDLKKVLTNVKTRGTWGEMQLGNLLEQILTPEQYAQNVITKQGSAERVEFAIKLPGRDTHDGKTVWLPIDAKFPKEDYERLVEASERADADAVEQAAKQLELRIKAEAGDIRDKYIDPPNTTDFGILFLPTESLYAEVLRRNGLMETLQREFRVVVTGPTTLAALLNSLQMGFRTLAIEKRSSEVWAVLGAIKTEFGKFGGIIEKVQKKLQEASNVIDTAATRTRTIERKLRTVEGLPTNEATALLGEAETEPPETDESSS